MFIFKKISIVSVMIFTAGVAFDLFAQSDNIVALPVPPNAAQVSDEYKNMSGSLGPLAFLFILFSDDESEPLNIPWISLDINWQTKNQNEMGAGFILRDDRFALKTQWRSFYNEERLSGIFWGLYGLVEWRQMDWNYDESGESIEVNFATSFPRANVYQSVGITAGVDVGFRYRGNTFGVTPYVGLGIPLFYMYGDLPPKRFNDEFYLTNVIYRAINAGMKIDVFF